MRAAERGRERGYIGEVGGDAHAPCGEDLVLLLVFGGLGDVTGGHVRLGQRDVG